MLSFCRKLTEALALSYIDVLIIIHVPAIQRLVLYL